MAEATRWMKSYAGWFLLVTGLFLMTIFTVQVAFKQVDGQKNRCRQGVEAAGYTDFVVLKYEWNRCEIAVTGQPSIHIVFPQGE